MNDFKNPLSPHLQIYRWHISSLLSITHRISGVINFISLILIIFWLVALSLGENNYESFLLMINSFFGKFILIGFTWSMSFHVLGGIRHLFWDLGYGFEIKTANISGIIVIISSLVLTIIFWLFARGFI
ncbi:MAG: succinate dehydrogenase, cytochrome b556 subunit [Candidatus Pelagibacterales bacterium]|nr:MAG: succinate dehydrogenase, cytochrome b556 subunit [Pelagibacterales bacterium]